MSKEIILPSGVIGVEAEYKEQILDEFKGNPFIEALPNLIIEREEIVKRLAFKVPIKREEILLPKQLKLTALNRVYKVFQPLPVHVEVFEIFNSLITQGYIPRNPFNPSYIQYINKTGEAIVNKNFNVDSNENFRTTVQCGLIIGISGAGKTSTVQRCLLQVPQIIVHNKYKGIQFSNIQVTWLKLEAPANGSIKALTLQFFHKLDQLLGTNNVDRYVSKHLSVDSMIPIMGQTANSIGLGLLVIDELQHLDKNFKQVISYMVMLMNSFGVSLLLIGTGACYEMLQQNLRIARRVTGAGAIFFNPMKNDKEFEIFLKGIWKYQFLNKKVKLTKEIIEVFYEKTQGIADLVVKLFVNTQRFSLNKGVDDITVEMIEKVWEKEFSMVKPMVEAIKSNNRVKKMQFDDIQEFGVAKSNAELKGGTNKVSTDSRNSDNTVIVNNSEVVKQGKDTKIKVSGLKDNDIRKIVIKGNKHGMNNYESLKEAGLITTLEDLLLDIRNA
ncbi:ATP-binding protein [Clostridium gasigenes]|nr:ATP-binding protein [Clostridium gasigenes]